MPSRWSKQRIDHDCSPFSFSKFMWLPRIKPNQISGPPSLSRRRSIFICPATDADSGAAPSVGTRISPSSSLRRGVSAVSHPRNARFLRFPTLFDGWFLSFACCYRLVIVLDSPDHYLPGVRSMACATALFFSFLVTMATDSLLLQPYLVDL